MADRDVLLAFQDAEDGGENGAFRGTVAVVESVGGRRHGNELFSAHGQVLEDGVVREVTGIHHAHLGGHKAVGDTVFYQEAVQGPQVVPYLFGDDADTGAAGEGGVLVHHIGVEAVAGKGGHLVSGLELIIIPVPGAEIDQVALLQHTALGRARGAGGVQQDIQVFGLGASCGLAFRQVVQLVRGEYGTVVIPYQRDQFLVGNQELGVGVLDHEIEALRRVGRIQWLIGAAGLHRGQGSLGHPGIPVNEHGHHLFFPEPESKDSGGQGVCVAVQLPVADGLALKEHGRGVRGGLGLLAEQVYHRLAQIYLLGVVVEAVQLLEALSVHKGKLRERHVLEHSSHHAFHGVGEGLDQGLGILAVVVGEGQFGGFFRSFNEDTQRELGGVLRKEFIFKRFPVDGVLFHQTHLVGQHHGRMEVKGRCHPREGIILEREGGGKVAVRLLEEIRHHLLPYFSGERHRVDKHTKRVGTAHVAPAIGHGAHKHFLLAAEGAYGYEGGPQEVTGRGDAQRVAACHHVGPYLLAQPHLVAHLVFLRLLVRDNAGFFFLSGHLLGKEGFGLAEFFAFLVGFLVFGVVEVGVVFLFRLLAFQGARELGQEDVVGVAVKDKVVEIGHQAQFAGRLDYIEPIQRAGEVEGLHKGLFQGLVILFAAEFDGRDFRIRFSGHQIHFSVSLFQSSGDTGMCLQKGQQGLFKGRYLCAFRESKDERQVVGRGRRIADAVQVQTRLLEGEFLGLILRAFLLGFLFLVLRQEDIKDIILNALQACRLGKTVHVRLQAVAFVQFGGQAKGAQGRQAAVVQRVCKAEAANPDAFLDDVTDFFLQHVERGHMGLLLVFLRFRLGQGLHVHLLVYIEGDGVYLHRDGRYHIRGLFAGYELIQFLDVDFLGADDIGREEFAGTHAGFVEGLHRNVLDIREFADDGFHFLELDAEAADLHLTVFSAHEFYLAVFPLADNVSGAVGPGVLGIFVKGVVHKHFGRFVRAVEVSQAHLGAGDPEFSLFSPGHLLSVLDYVRLDVFHRPADGDVLFLLFDLFVHHVADGFRGAVAVEQAVVRQREAGHLFAAGVHGFEALAVRIVDGKLRGHLGGHKAARDAVFLKVIVQGGQVEPDALRDDIKSAAADEGTVQV